MAPFTHYMHKFRQTPIHINNLLLAVTLALEESSCDGPMHGFTKMHNSIPLAARLA